MEFEFFAWVKDTGTLPRDYQESISRRAEAQRQAAVSTVLVRVSTNTL